MHKKNITIGYACLKCRKVFKKHKYNQDKNGSWSKVEYEVVCPQCSNVMYETGTAFKAPKSSNVKAWNKLKPLFESGYKFQPDFGNPFEESTPVKIKPRNKQSLSSENRREKENMPNKQVKLIRSRSFGQPKAVLRTFLVATYLSR